MYKVLNIRVESNTLTRIRVKSHSRVTTDLQLKYGCLPTRKVLEFVDFPIRGIRSTPKNGLNIFYKMLVLDILYSRSSTVI